MGYKNLYNKNLFKVKLIKNDEGVYIGSNCNGGEIVLDTFLKSKSRRKNRNAFVLGIPGEGKCFSLKQLRGEEKNE